MREQKFKVWDTINQEWFDETVVLLGQDGKLKFWHTGKQIIESLDEKTYIPVFSTGLFDKNGKEIYEGYILSHIVFKKWKSADVVSYNNEKAMFELLHKGEPDKPKDIFVYLLESEIIGNIYENPELLSE